MQVSEARSGARGSGPGAPSRVCDVEGCDKKHHAKGYCWMHYCRFRTHGHPLAGRGFHIEVCTVEGCDEPHTARGICRKHYERKKRTGSLESSWRTGCDIPGCDRKHYGRGFCKKHYDLARWLQEDPAPRERRVPISPIRELIADSGLTWAVVAEKAGYDVRCFYTMMKTQTWILIGNADRIAVALNQHLIVLYPELYDEAA